jgi:type IX secretion system PorP/SprF family membrane protein
MRSQAYSHYKISIFAAFLLGFVTCCTTQVKAQLNPLGSQYFQNQYLFNPAMAGINQGLNINLAYSKQGIGVDGSQSIQSVSADYQADKVGLGINVLNEYSGLFRTTKAVATYAYHLPVGGDNQKLNFGLSGGITNQHIQTSDIIGDQGDLTVARYNEKQNYLGGDFGISYTSNKLTIQGALPDLQTLFKDNDVVEREVFFTSASYKLFDPTDISLEPKIVCREIKGFNTLIDAGADLSFNGNAFSIQAMYHSSNSATFGVGVNETAYSIFAFYTTNTSSLSSYNNGDFEFGLRFNVLNKK